MHRQIWFNGSMFELKTERLLLRDFQAEDVLDYKKVGDHAGALKYYPQSASEWATHVDGLVDKFREWRLKQPRLKYALAIIKNGSFVGTISVRVDSPEHRQGAIGCGLGYEHWSKGYASEAMAAVLTLGFEGLNLHRIYAETISDNRAAVVLAVRLGMRLEGEIRENQYFKGRWWNSTIYSLLRSEWKDRSSR